MENYKISDDQQNVEIEGQKHVFVSYKKTATLNNPCDHCSVIVLCEKNPDLFPCCDYERKDNESGIYKLKK